MAPLLYEQASALAEKMGLPHVSVLADHTPNDGLFLPSHTALYHHYQFLPYARMHGTLLIATSAPNDALRELAETLYNQPVSFVIASSRDMMQWIGERAANHHARSAVHALRRKFRHLCADRTLLRSQIWPITWPVLLGIGALMLATQSAIITIIVLCNVFYLASLLFKFLVYRTWKTTHKQIPPAPEMNPMALPIYTLFVPIFHEPAHVLQQLIRAIENLDYPSEKKDVIFICEDDDEATIHALKQAAPPHYCRILRVPKSNPRTKPKALNVALAFAKGEIAVIFDAEDIPDPQQLKQAAARFAEDAELACLQAPLNYYNHKENLLTQLFAIEYGTLFRMQLPALEALNMPIPLGGTSNHIRLQVLRDACGWDAFNVTEDADLGMRLSLFGKKIQVLDSTTMEEAPITIRAWLHQRSRWIKGYIQTWLVYMRNPKHLKATLGPRAYYGFQFFIGAPALTFIIAPFFWALFLISMTGNLSLSLPIWVSTLCIVCLIAGVYSHWLYARACIHLHRWEGMGIAAVIYPFYWLLHILASFIALYDLAFRPHHWRKTGHGLSRVLANKSR